jgi:ATP-dependent RNA helicase DeaD
MCELDSRQSRPPFYNEHKKGFPFGARSPSVRGCKSPIQGEKAVIMEKETATTSQNTGVASLGLDGTLLAALAALGYEEPTPIQQQAIPVLLEGRDMVGQAATGTGKTAAFSLPLIQRLTDMDRSHRQPVALILVPTRELAIQVSEAIHRYGRDLGVSVVPIYGGQSYGPQIRSLERGVDIVVATPGRAMDHMRRGTLRLSRLAAVVLDEADEMLDMGFQEDIETILAETPGERQTMLFSATLPPRIAGMAKRYLRNPAEIKIAPEKVSTDAMPRVQQSAYIVNRAQKPEALGRILDMENPTAAIIFCRTRMEVEDLSAALLARGYQAEILHGGMAQAQRDRVIKKLRAAQVDLVLATDVASRGLDIEQLTHVFNYDVPASPETYVHRIGRVGRAGREGAAITLVEPKEHRQLRNIEQITKQKIKILKVPSVSDLHSRRLEMTHAAIREAILSEGLDTYRVVVDGLMSEFDIVEIALGAIKHVHQSMGGEGERDTIEIVSPTLPVEIKPRKDHKRSGPPSRGFQAKKSGAPKRPGPASKSQKSRPRRKD